MSARPAPRGNFKGEGECLAGGAVPGPGVTCVDLHPAADFVAGMGVCMHLEKNTGAWADTARLKTELGQLGIRHLREAYFTDSVWTALRTFDSLGIRVDVLAAPGMPISQLVAAAVDPERGGPWAESLEPPTETGAVAASGNPTLPIFQGSFRNPDKASLVGDLSALFDYGNLNSFPDGTLPDWQLDGWYRPEIHKVSGTRPLVVSGTGYQNALHAEPSDPPMWQSPYARRPVSEAAAARYITRLWVEYLERGVVRVFLYNLIDVEDTPDVAGKNFGLLRNDFTEKPAFLATRNLITPLREPDGQRALAGTLDVRFEGAISDLRTSRAAMQRSGSSAPWKGERR